MIFNYISEYIKLVKVIILKNTNIIQKKKNIFSRIIKNSCI